MIAVDISNAEYSRTIPSSGLNHGEVSACHVVYDELYDEPLKANILFSLHFAHVKTEEIGRTVSVHKYTNSNKQ